MAASRSNKRRSPRNGGNDSNRSRHFGGDVALNTSSKAGDDEERLRRLVVAIGVDRAMELIEELEAKVSPSSKPTPAALLFHGNCPWCHKDLAQQPQPIDWNKAGVTIHSTRDGSNISLELTTPQRGTLLLRPYSPFKVLLALAEKRLDDLKRGKKESEAGWMTVEELGRKIKRNRLWINIAVLRIRRALQRFGADPIQDIVERRLKSHELRIAVQKPKIVLE